MICTKTIWGDAPDLISEDEMRALIKAEADAVGGVHQLCRTLHMKSPAPVYLTLQKDRPVSDGISLHFGYELQRMYRRIGNASRA